VVLYRTDVVDLKGFCWDASAVEAGSNAHELDEAIRYRDADFVIRKLASQ
jgi:hypothetical protein